VLLGNAGRLKENPATSLTVTPSLCRIAESSSIDTKKKDRSGEGRGELDVNAALAVSDLTCETRAELVQKV